MFVAFHANCVMTFTRKYDRFLPCRFVHGFLWIIAADVFELATFRFRFTERGLGAGDNNADTSISDLGSRMLAPHLLARDSIVFELPAASEHKIPWALPISPSSSTAPIKRDSRNLVPSEPSTTTDRGASYYWPCGLLARAAEA